MIHISIHVILISLNSNFYIAIILKQSIENMITPNEGNHESNTSIKILYGSVTGKSKVSVQVDEQARNHLLNLFVFAKHFANEFLKDCIQKGISDCSLIDMKNYDPEDGLVNDVCLFSFD